VEVSFIEMIFQFHNRKAFGYVYPVKIKIRNEKLSKNCCNTLSPDPGANVGSGPGFS
jgi:hypothetical protein